MRNMSHGTARAESYRVLFPFILFLGGGAVFGTVARALIESMELNPNPLSALWVLNHLTSGTWLWAVIATLFLCLQMNHSPRRGCPRYLESFVLCVGFLSATTIAWYGGVTPPAQLPLLTIAAFALCALPSAGIALVGAFGRLPGLAGLLVRLCLPAGLALILLVTPPPPLEHGGNSAAEILVWQVLMSANVGLAVIFLSHFLIVGRRKGAASPALC